MDALSRPRGVLIKTDIAAGVRLLVEYLSRASGDVVEVRVEEGPTGRRSGTEG
jgi:hypothetical protein